MIKLKPALKDYLWGGNKLKNEYGKISEIDIVAESWELSTHPDGLSTIEEGACKGKSLIEYIKTKGKQELGNKCEVENDIPILIKFIDAKDDLSIQVHPDDAYALKHEGDYGKTEMWYVLEADENSELIYGFSKDMTKEEFKLVIENHTLTEVINHVKVQKGDVFFIEPGMMHAIGKGIMIAEIQQRSNVTYRIYDFDRVGVDGKPRELHIDKALEVTKLTKALDAKVKYELIEGDGYKSGLLASCEYFHVELIEISKGVKLSVDETTFHSLLVVEGNGQIISEKEKIEVDKGDSVFLPAGYGDYRIEGNCKVILSTL